MSTVHEAGPTATTEINDLNHQLELTIGGMTCASCAARIEKKLNRLEGVCASVNFATEKARVRYADGVIPDDLVATVARTGYAAALSGYAVSARSLPRHPEPGGLLIRTRRECRWRWRWPPLWKLSRRTDG